MIPDSWYRFYFDIRCLIWFQCYCRMPYHGMFMPKYVTGLLNWLNCVFMPPPLGARGIMFSGCPSVRPSARPSVRSLKCPLFTCTWVHWSIWPTVTVLHHVRLSVRAFAGERMEGMAWIFTYRCILTTFRTNYIMVMVCWFSFVWCHFD